MLDLVADGYLREGKRYVTVAIGCTGGKHRSVAMAENLAAGCVKAGRRDPRRAPRPRARVSGTGAVPRRTGRGRTSGPGTSGAGRGARRRPRPGSQPAGAATRHRRHHRRRRRVATTEAPAVGCAASSASLPPGDLRMALAALCGDDEWGRTWSRVVQHRFSGSGELSGHAVGNLLIVAIWEETGDIVDGARLGRRAARRARRVLPMATVPLTIVADGRRAAIPTTPAGSSGSGAGGGGDHTRRGRGACASSRPTPPACPEAVQAVGPPTGSCSGRGRGSPACSRTCSCPASPTRGGSPGRGVVVLNLAPQPGETSGFSPRAPPRGARRARPGAARRHGARGSAARSRTSRRSPPRRRPWACRSSLPWLARRLRAPRRRPARQRLRRHLRRLTRNGTGPCVGRLVASGPVQGR